MQRNLPRAIRVANQVRVQLRKDLVRGGRLPSENTMAARLGVSRGTVRQALAILQQEGLISRRQGQGTFANPHVSGIPIQINYAYEFSELIAAAGYEPAIQLLDFREQAADEDTARRLNLRRGAPMLQFSKLFFANGQPAIYAHVQLPAALIVEPYETAELKQPLLGFIEQRCHSELKYVLSELVPSAAEGEVAERLQVAPGSPLLRFLEVFYGKGNEPLVLAKVSFREPLVRFHALRKVTQYN